MASISAQPGGCVAEPIAQIIVRLRLISRVITAEIQICDQPIQSLLAAILAMPLGTPEPAVHRSIAIRKFLKVNPVLESDGCPLGHLRADVL